MPLNKSSDDFSINTMSGVDVLIACFVKFYLFPFTSIVNKNPQLFSFCTLYCFSFRLFLCSVSIFVSISSRLKDTDSVCEYLVASPILSCVLFVTTILVSSLLCFVLRMRFVFAGVTLSSFSCSILVVVCVLCCSVAVFQISDSVLSMRCDVAFL